MFLKIEFLPTNRNVLVRMKFFCGKNRYRFAYQWFFIINLFFSSAPEKLWLHQQQKKFVRILHVIYDFRCVLASWIVFGNLWSEIFGNYFSNQIRWSKQMQQIWLRIQEIKIMSRSHYFSKFSMHLKIFSDLLKNGEWWCKSDHEFVVQETKRHRKPSHVVHTSFFFIVGQYYCCLFFTLDLTEIIQVVN